MPSSRPRSRPSSSRRRRLLALLLAGAAGAAPGATGWTLSQDGGDLVLRQEGVERRRLPIRSLDGRERGTLAGQAFDAGRQAFVVVFAGLAELWELSIDPEAEPVYEGLVHDYRMGEGVAGRGFLGLRRTRLPEPASALALASAGYALVRGADLPDGRAVLHVVQRDVRLTLARLVLDGQPDLARALEDPGQSLMRVPAVQAGAGWQIDFKALRLR